MYNNQIIKMYDLKNRIKKHPYDTILNLDEFIKISKEHFLTSAICSVAPNENNFLNAKQIEMEPQQNVESIENEINKCRANTNIDFKFYYCYFWYDPFESKEQKEQIINHLEQNQLPQIYIYDWESKTGNTMPMNELHKIINYVLELTPQQWFDKFKNDYFKQIFNDDAIEEMQQMFLHMPFDVLEIKQPTLFDDVESYQPQINIIESKEHKFFEILLLNIDLFIDDEQGIKSYYDYLLQIQMEQCDNKITMLDCNLNDVNDKIKYYEQQTGIQDLTSYQHQINEIVALIDDVSFYNEIMPTNDNIINIAQSKTKQLNDIQNTTPYLYYLALKQYINNRIDLLKDKQSEVQQQMENCKKIGTTEYFINANIKKYLSKINKNHEILPNIPFNYMTSKTTQNYYTTNYLHNILTTTEIEKNFHNTFSVAVPMPNQSIDVKVHYDEHGTTTEPINDFDKIVHDALCTLIEKHITQYSELSQTKPLLFTNQMILDAMKNYPTYKNNEELEKINKSIEKCRRIKILIDSENEFKKYYPNELYYTFDSEYMPVHRVIGSIQGNKKECWMCTQMPPFYEYGKRKNQIASYPTRWLSYGKSNTLEMYNLKLQIIKRINEFKSKEKNKNKAKSKENDKQQYHISIDTLIKNCKIIMPMEHVAMRKKRNKIIKYIREFLDDLKKDEQGIKSYKFYTKSQNKEIETKAHQTIVGVAIDI